MPGKKMENDPRRSWNILLEPTDQTEEIDSEEGHFSEASSVEEVTQKQDKYVSKYGKTLTKEEWERRKRIQDEFQNLLE